MLDPGAPLDLQCCELTSSLWFPSLRTAVGWVFWCLSNRTSSGCSPHPPSLQTHRCRCFVFTLSSCNVNFCAPTRNMIYFYSQCLRSELVIQSPIRISPSAASCYSFGIRIMWVFAHVQKHVVWRSEGVQGFILLKDGWLIHRLISIA